MSNPARVLSANKDAVAMILARPLARWEKFAGDCASMEPLAFARWEALPLADYLINFLRTGDRTWRDLYLGERLKQLDWPADSVEQAAARSKEVLTSDRDDLIGLLRPHLSDNDTAGVYECLDSVIRLATTPARHVVRALMIGDCLMLQLFGFLSASLLQDGIKLRPLFLTSKNPLELGQSIQAVADKEFDLVCFSPYSYQFNSWLAQTLRFRRVIAGKRALDEAAIRAHKQTESILSLLINSFDCSVLVHYTANLKSFEADSWISYVKTIATRPRRRDAGVHVNGLLERVVAEHNNSASRPILTIDERVPVSLHGEHKLGREIYSTLSQHPTFFALELSHTYRDVIGTISWLVGKKVVVTDLDGTLWEGAIGEGAVQHAHRRQKTLKRLAQKGVLLAIASKNDPQRVHFNGALLSEHDFVASQISWDPKHLSLQRIASELNLRLEDFVFVDDVAEERGMIREALPMVHTLDANSERTWQMLDWWAAALPGYSGTDRTLLYREREARQTYLDQEVKEEHEKLLAGLELRLYLRCAGPNEMPRVSELMSRTNQFNTYGRRPTPRQIVEWATSPSQRILIAEAKDKFGSMGIISAMALTVQPDLLEISAWMLSCRAFGYGIETAMLNYLKSVARQLGYQTMRGWIVESPDNQPAREVFSSNGFALKDEAWSFSFNIETPDPSWLKVIVDADAIRQLGALERALPEHSSAAPESSE
jgi:FkbH-like protein